MKSLYSIFFFSMFISFCFSQEGEAMGAVVRDHDNQYPPKPNTVFNMVEVEAEYPGGINSLFKFIYRNIEYPKIAIENRIQGRILMKFVVEKDGSISNVTIIKDICDGCGEEAIRVLMLTSGKWKPGLMEGKPVRSYYRLPVTFSLP